MHEFNNDESFSGSRKNAVIASIDPTNVAVGEFKNLLTEYAKIPLSYKKVAKRIMLSRVEELLDEFERNKK